ncbi:EmrB/QacA subfamily drug resistance transporter [Paenibacillus phyllosphaerae]|uniref:EmrB/QacA subfamily drug resistance transporter n=1 Tax=Paenibacillus phyllosphaerae TaxID=274593 RepID=A0A7W5FRH4_9BACL|nr:DHA2 family efflux MFS transporter permease subunit [Paenibacillus phyllosphaerae]MBB3114029.1 EmrB/QacA subfamily drug resistance transporter [Paenibacillus phyllosphaerae]
MTVTAQSFQVRSGAISYRWWALIALALAQFLVVLDASIVNIALPAIGSELHMGTSLLGWVITAYVLPFGGLLLLGGRLSDRFGHRRLFIAGVAGFSIASVAAGLSVSGEWLLMARAIQGTSAALLAPAALALLTKLFADPQDRAKALGIWGAVAGIGSAAGVLLGGILTSFLGWSSVFYVNVPVGILVIAAVPFLIPKDVPSEGAGMDMSGAAAVTAGITALVAALSGTERVGWTSTQTLVLAGLAVILLSSFIFLEKRAANPLMPLTIFRNRWVTGGNLAMFLIGGATTALFFALSVYMQQVLHYDAMKAGLTQLPMAAALVAIAGVVPAIVTAFGTGRSLAASLLLLAAGLVWLSFAPSDAAFMIHLLGPTMLIGVGLGGAFVSGTEAAVHGVADDETGHASGLVNTSQQIGGAIGMAVLTALSSARTNGLLEQGVAQPQALTGGFGSVFLGAAALAILGAIVVLTVVPGHKKEEVV